MSDKNLHFALIQLQILCANFMGLTMWFLLSFNVVAHLVHTREEEGGVLDRKKILKDKELLVLLVHESSNTP